MTNAVQKWGNSLGLRIPATIANELHIKKGTPVELRVEDGVLTVRVARARRRKSSRFKLSELVARITPENLKSIYDWGNDVGTEVIS